MTNRIKALFFAATLGLCLGLGACAGLKETVASSETKPGFVISRPINGVYYPVRDRKDAGHSGEVLTIMDGTFRHQTFTNMLNDTMAGEDYSGKIVFADDHIFLDHPGMELPYRFAGVLDGVSVILDWSAFETWKKTGTLSRWGVLYLQTP